VEGKRDLLRVATGGKVNCFGTRCRKKFSESRQAAGRAKGRIPGVKHQKKKKTEREGGGGPTEEHFRAGDDAGGRVFFFFFLVDEAYRRQAGFPAP
jgi:hypothetical protein